MPHRMLLADDSLTIQKVVELTFSDSGYELMAVGSGDKAVQALEHFNPDIVLADVVMPGLSGYDVCEHVKALAGGEFIPVILLTGTFEPFDRSRAERVGCDSIVTKPFDSHVLATQVKDLLARAAHARAMQSAAPPTDSPAPVIAEVQSPPRPDHTVAVPALSGWGSTQQVASADPFGAVSSVEETETEPLYATTALRIPSAQELADMAARSRTEALPAVTAEPFLAEVESPPVHQFETEQEVARPMEDLEGEASSGAFPEAGSESIAASHESHESHEPHEHSPHSHSEAGASAPPELDRPASSDEPESPSAFEMAYSEQASSFSSAPSPSAEAHDHAQTSAAPEAVEPLPFRDEVPPAASPMEFEETLVERPFPFEAAAEHETTLPLPRATDPLPPAMPIETEPLAEAELSESIYEDATGPLEIPSLSDEASVSALFENEEAAQSAPPAPPAEPDTLPGVASSEIEPFASPESEAPHRDVQEDMEAFERSGRASQRASFWDDLPTRRIDATDVDASEFEDEINSSESAEAPARAFVHEDPEPSGPIELEALAAGASLSDLIPAASAAKTSMGEAPSLNGSLSDGDVDRIARRVVELLGDKVVREIAWDVVPEMAERFVRARIQELESEPS